MRYRRWIPAAAWALVIFGLSSIHGSSIPGGWSPLGHLVAYAVLGALVFGALQTGGTRRRIIAAVAIASAYGVTDEIHQLFVPGRMCDPADWLVDTVGALIGAALMLALLRHAIRSPE